MNGKDAMATDRIAASATDTDIASAIIAAADKHRQIDLLTDLFTGFDLKRAYRVSAKVTELRIARGEKPVGRKIGFTNAKIWPEYGIYDPIWGPIYDTTFHQIENVGEAFDISRFLEPRIEPEIMLGLGRAPSREMDEKALLDCVDWIAHGFEIVHSVFPAWKFETADTIAAFGLHGAYIMGSRHEITAADKRDWLERLPSFSINLLCNDRVVDNGKGSSVLGGPLSALRHLVKVLDESELGPPLGAGECITTGTLTSAMPIKPEETWSTEISGIDLTGIRIRFSQE